MNLSHIYTEEGYEVRLLGEMFELNPNCQGLFFFFQGLLLFSKCSFFVASCSCFMMYCLFISQWSLYGYYWWINFEVFFFLYTFCFLPNCLFWSWSFTLDTFLKYLVIFSCLLIFYFILFFFNKKFYWRKIEPPCTQGKEHKNSTDTELKVTITQGCLRLLFNFLNGFHQFFK